jgi:hypothetical protein
MSTPKTATKRKPKVAKAETVIVAYKGFNRRWMCRNFQYKVGKSYTHAGAVRACNSGFHACEYPLDVFSYYAPDQSHYAVVKQAGTLDRQRGDNKVASSKITIEAQIGIPGLVKAAIEWTRKAAENPTSGDSANSATSGDSAHSATSGDSAHSATSGNYAHSATSGYSAHSATSGYSAHSATSGDSANSATSGNYANSATSGYSTQVEAKGTNAVAAIAGSGIARAGKGGAIFLVERSNSLAILAVFASKVGENGIEPDVWYTLKDGKPVEVTP